ncbi:cation:proton antiporter [Saccharopolyspora elongata]|uniref:Sodium:proton exchanger n=1 Tax=Saccharopolyspora elongata TaxID=2530387 RepID=A0A4R4XVA8_9PSEU|nr:cation:proton antiporter family protein [Saccharopolyspora elongata]TDD34929.1 sodium:proton exchanger [Saccharopolyspora elongata]
MSVHDFYTFAAVLAVAAAVGLLATRLRQPLIVAFIAVGILVGPVGTGWVTGGERIDLLAHLGIAILLFLVGLRLDLHLIRTTGPVALATGLGQVLFTSVVGFGIALGLGMDPITAFYVAVALTFSSTIIIVKLLSDKRELDELHGRIAVGFLIVQDLVVVLTMIALTAFGRQTGTTLAVDMATTVGKGLGMLAGLALAMRYVIPWLLHHVARSQELLVLFGVAWAVALAALSDWLGFGTEVGAFLAGVSLASTPYREAIGARLVSLRDFLLLFFFLNLGAQLQFTDATRQITDAVVFSLFVLIGNPLIVVLIMCAMRYPVRVGFLAGLTVAQISEFSLILAALGLSLGHITTATVSLITIVGLITITASTYLILYSKQLYRRLHRWLAPLDRSHTRTAEAGELPADIDVILYGLGRFGSRVAHQLTRAGYRVLGVDFDPKAVATWNNDPTTAVFGSGEDPDFLHSLPLHQARWVVSTIPGIDTNLALLHGLRHHNYQGRIALTAHTQRDAHRLNRAKPDIVLEPFSSAATATLSVITTDLGPPTTAQ